MEALAVQEAAELQAPAGMLVQLVLRERVGLVPHARQAWIVQASIRIARRVHAKSGSAEKTLRPMARLSRFRPLVTARPSYATALARKRPSTPTPTCPTTASSARRMSAPQACRRIPRKLKARLAQRTAARSATPRARAWNARVEAGSATELRYKHAKAGNGRTETPVSISRLCAKLASAFVWTERSDATALDGLKSATWEYGRPVLRAGTPTSASKVTVFVSTSATSLGVGRKWLVAAPGWPSLLRATILTRSLSTGKADMRTEPGWIASEFRFQTGGR